MAAKQQAKSLATLLSAGSFGIFLVFSTISHAEDAPASCGNVTIEAKVVAHDAPYDYRSAEARIRAQIRMVEFHHWNRDLQQLKKGVTGFMGSDLNFILRVIPNHYPALQTMGALSIKEKTLQPKGAPFPVECYFRRAVSFKPDDSTVYLVWGIYLAKAGKPAEALRKYQKAESLHSQDPELAHNMGLVYFELKDYEKANIYAQKAEKLGYPFHGLKNKLKRIGKWKGGDTGQASPN